MKTAYDIIALLFVHIVSVTGPRPDPCTTGAHFVDENWRRSTKHQLASAFLSLSDYSMRAGWYRFNSTAGGTIPNTCPRPNSCGTTGPIWAEGSLPTRVGKNFEVNLTAYGSISAGCKTFEWRIYARKCNENGETFYIYDLKSPTDRQLSYCAGTEIPCPPDWNSPTGFTPGCTPKKTTATGSVSTTTETTRPTQHTSKPKEKSKDKETGKGNLVVIVLSVVLGTLIITLVVIGSFKMKLCLRQSTNRVSLVTV